jgi:TetR/AcrR family transcriptional repressor of mexJK operon
LPERILASARALFLEQGFAATSVQQIAAHAGVTKRTLYVKIGDKDALFRAVVDELMQGWRHSLDGAAAALPLRARLELIGRQLLSVIVAPDMVRLHRVLYGEVYRSPALLEILVQQSEAGPIPQLALLLMEERGGTGAPSLHDMVAARLLHDMISAAPLRMALFGRAPSIPVTAEQWVGEAVDLFLRGWQHSGPSCAGSAP